MKALAFCPKNSGPGYHRILMPLLMIPELDVYITNNLLEEHFEGIDVFMYNRVLPDHAMEKLWDLQKKYGFKVVVDIDDYWELDPHHVLYQDYVDQDFAATQVAHIEDADAVFCTHERLCQLIAPLNPNVHILPNAIPHCGQFAIEREEANLTRLFWQGSDTHREDISLLATPVEKLKDYYGKVKMVMSGYAQNNKEWFEMAKAYTGNFNAQYKLMPYAPVTAYYDAYKHADICLIPLINSAFNRNKSPLKVLEAANMGLPCIVSKVHPYMDMPVLYCSNSGDWVTHIICLLKSKNYQQDCGERLAEFAEEHYNFDRINLERKQILEHIAKMESV